MNSTESKMSVWELMLLTAVNMIGAGIILLPASLAQVGGISIFSWIITTFCATCLAYAFAKCGMYLWDGWKFPVLLYLYGIDSGIECGHCAFGCGLWSYVP